MKIKVCNICNKKFVAISSNHLYCDHCRFIKCLKCNLNFLIKPKAKKREKFCSKNCFDKWQTGRKQSIEIIKKCADGRRGRKTGIFKKCNNCQKEIYRYPKDIERAKNYYCSTGCFIKYKIKNASPKRNNKGKDKKWKKAVYKSDNYTCWICGVIGKKLNAHHLKSWAKYPKLRFVISNGITLCEFCHRIYTEWGYH